MSKKVLALSIILLLTTVSLASISLGKAAGEGQWITSYQISDTATQQLLMEYDSATNLNKTYTPITPGEEITVTFNLHVFPGDSSTDLKLSTSLSKGSTSYWDLVSTNYDMGPNYNPAKQATSFNWVEGDITLTLNGKVPSSSGSAAKSISIFSLYGPSGGVAIDQITVLVTTGQMQTYLSLYNQQNDKLKGFISSGVDQNYIDIYTNVLNASKAVADGGDVPSAIALLNGLDTAGVPGQTMPIIFYPIVGVTAAIAIVFVVLFMRSRSKVSYMQLVVEDQIKDLEGLTLRASKIDRAMSANLDSVKDRLKRLVGM